MARVADPQGLKIHTREVDAPDFAYSRKKKFYEYTQTVCEIRGLRTRCYRQDDGWWIDNVRVDEDMKFTPVGPFNTLEAAWLAQQILKD